LVRFPPITAQLLRREHAFGDGVLALGDGVLALGDGVLALGDGVLALGDGVLALGDGVLALGDVLGDAFLGDGVRGLCFLVLKMLPYDPNSL
jgi:hypothetical protein